MEGGGGRRQRGRRTSRGRRERRINDKNAREEDIKERRKRKMKNYKVRLGN